MPKPNGHKAAQRARDQEVDDETPKEPPSVEERVRIIKVMMATGEWRTGVSDHELAESWGIDANTVRKSSAEASRALGSAIADQEMGAMLVSLVLDNAHDAKKAGRFEAVARSVEVAAKILGLDGKQLGNQGPKRADIHIHLADDDKPE